MNIKKIAIFFFAFVFLFGGFSFVRAAEFVNPGSSGSSRGMISIAQSEIHKNLYTAGSQVTVNSMTTGDLTVAGGTLILNGPVSGELLAAGGTIDDNSSVAGTARVAGGTIGINAPVGGDLVVAGGNIFISGSSQVGGDLVAAGGTVFINSKISGNVNVYANNLSFGPQAEIPGNISYKGPKPANVDPAAKISHIEFTQVGSRNKNSTRGIFTLAVLIHFIALLIVGFIFLWLCRGFFENVFSRARTRPWASLGLGLLALIGVPIVIIVLFITVIGYYAALIATFSYLTFVVIAAASSSLVLGYFILRLFNRQRESFPGWQVVLVGVIIWQILSLIPIVGWIITLIIFVMTTGALLMHIWETKKRTEV